MPESIHEYVVERLMASRGRWPQIAADIGMSRRTIEKIARREVENPGVKAVEKIADYFRSQRVSA